MSFVLGSKVAEIWKAGTVIFCNDSKISHFSREFKVVKSQKMQNRSYFTNFFQQINSWFFWLNQSYHHKNSEKLIFSRFFFNRLIFKNRNSKIGRWREKVKSRFAFRNQIILTEKSNLRNSDFDRKNALDFISKDQNKQCNLTNFWWKQAKQGFLWSMSNTMLMSDF